MIIKNNQISQPSTPLRPSVPQGHSAPAQENDNPLSDAFGFVAQTMTRSLDAIVPGLSGAMHPLFTHPVVNAVRRHLVPVLREAGHQALVLHTKGRFMDLDPMKNKALGLMEKGDQAGADRIVAAMERYQNAEKKQWDALEALKELYPAGTTIPLQLDYSENNPLVKRWMQTYRPWEPKIDALRALPVVSVFQALERSADAGDREMAARIRTAMDSLIEPNYPPFESIEDLDKVTNDINDVFGSAHIDDFVRKVREQRTKSWMADPSFRNRVEIQSGFEALERLSRLPEAATDEDLKKLIAAGEEGLAVRIGKMMPQAGTAAFRLMGRFSEIKAMPALSDRIAAYRELTTTLDTEILKHAVASNLAAFRAMKPTVATSDRVLNGLMSVSGFHFGGTTSGFDGMIRRYEQVQALINEGKIAEARTEFSKIESASLNGELKDNYESSQVVNAGAGLGVVVAAALGMEGVTAAVGPELTAALGEGLGSVATLATGAVTFRTLHNYLDAKLQNDPSIFYDANRSLLGNFSRFGGQATKDFAMFLTLGAALGRYEKFADARGLQGAVRTLGRFGTEMTALQGFSFADAALTTGDTGRALNGTVLSGQSWLQQTATALGLKLATGAAGTTVKEAAGFVGDLFSGLPSVGSRVAAGVRSLLATPETASRGSVMEDALILAEDRREMEATGARLGKETIFVRLVPQGDGIDMNYAAVIADLGFGRRPTSFSDRSNLVAIYVDPSEADTIREQVNAFAQKHGVEISTEEDSGEITITAPVSALVPDLEPSISDEEATDLNRRRAADPTPRNGAGPKINLPAAPSDGATTEVDGAPADEGSFGAAPARPAGNQEATVNARPKPRKVNTGGSERIP